MSSPGPRTVSRTGHARPNRHRPSSAVPATGLPNSWVLNGWRAHRPLDRREPHPYRVRMSLTRVHNFAISLDCYGTCEGQTLEAPFGHAGHRLMEWAFETRTFREMGFHGETAGSVGVDNAFASRWGAGIGAEIMGRNKFGPQRGPWTDEQWRG